MQVQKVMARYRALKEQGLTGLEASIQVRKEGEEAGGRHWHRLYERCWCGFLTVPARFYKYDDKGNQTNTQGEAEGAFLADGGVDRDTEMLVRYGVKQNRVKQAVLNTCECGNEIKGRGQKCAACYQRAYRERSK